MPKFTKGDVIYTKINESFTYVQILRLIESNESIEYEIKFLLGSSITKSLLEHRSFWLAKPIDKGTWKLDKDSTAGILYG